MKPTRRIQETMLQTERKRTEYKTPGECSRCHRQQTLGTHFHCGRVDVGSGWNRWHAAGDGTLKLTWGTLRL
ncbi:unnamed protein product [Laminaria digitata]